SCLCRPGALGLPASLPAASLPAATLPAATARRAGRVAGTMLVTSNSPGDPVSRWFVGMATLLGFCRLETCRETETSRKRVYGSD
ncbi:hypothetical protein KUCAC02_033546, partial [Chaenocephalus aceratus]